MTDRWPAHGFVGRARLSGVERRQSMEEDVRTLHALVPDVSEELHSMFESAVATSLARMLPENRAEALRTLVRRSGSMAPYEVYSALESMFHEGSQILVDEIKEEFGVSIHSLLEQVERGFAADPTPPILLKSR